MSNVNTQRSLGFLVVGVIVTVIIAIAGLYWFFAKPQVKFVTTPSPGAAMFVSKLAPVMVSLLGNPEGLQSQDPSGELSHLKTSLLAHSAINYQKDIKPWLGNEITLSVTSLDIDRDPDNGMQPGYLMALATDKPRQSREFLDLLFSQGVLAGGNLAVEQYQGVKLLSDGYNSLAGAIVGEFVLFANHPKVLREAINNVQAPGLNLLSSSPYQRASQQLPKKSLATAFFNLPALAQWQGWELPSATFHSQMISLSVNSQGLWAETNFLSDSILVAPSPSVSQPVAALEYIPDGASLIICGSDLNNLGDSDLGQLWTQIKTVFSSSGTDGISGLVAPLTELEKNQGMTLKGDIFSWVKGEYALALLPQRKSTAVDWVFVVENKEDVPQGVAGLDAIAASRGLSLSSVNLNEQKIYAWTKLTAAAQAASGEEGRKFAIDAQVQGVHTILGNYQIFASSLEVLDQVMTNNHGALMADGQVKARNRNFLDSMAAIPKSNQGYVYVDWTKSKTLLESQLPILQVLEIVGQPFFHNLRSLTISSYGEEAKLLKGGVLMQFLH